MRDACGFGYEDEDDVDGTDTDDLASHYRSSSTLEWLRKMSWSYEYEYGESLLDVMTTTGEEDDMSRRGDGGVGVRKEEDDDDDDDDDDEGDSSYIHRLATAIAKSDLHVSSHDFLRAPNDPIYNYANVAFLHKFGYDWDEFVITPSRYCVSSNDEVVERKRILDDVRSNASSYDGRRRRDGNDDDRGGTTSPSSEYDGLVRVRKDGRRILLRGVNLWNVYDVDVATYSGCDDLSSSRVRADIETGGGVGGIDIIGQAVWIKHIEYLD